MAEITTRTIITGRRESSFLDGRPLISRRYAIDWGQIDKGSMFSGDAHDAASYTRMQGLLAVADGTVVTAKAGLPDNVPGHNESFHPAVPITMERCRQHRHARLR